nr:MAG: C-5 cytosine-specific DNA methylase [Bacteriophage sp.]
MKLLIGGSPCTHWSIAQTKNRETEASGIGWELFLNYRIARDKYKPDYFLYENNKSMSSAIRTQITAELGVEPVLINSALMSAQNRQRLYWVGRRNQGGTYSQVPVEQPVDRGILLRDILETSAVTWKEKAYTLRASAGTKQGVSNILRHIETNGKFGYMGAAEPVAIKPLTEREMDYMVGEHGKYSDRWTYLQKPGEADKALCITANVHRGVPYNICAELVRIGTIENDPDHDSQQYRFYSTDGKSVTLCGNGGGLGAKTGLYSVPCCMRYERSPEAKRLRKQYEAHEISHGFHEFSELHPRTDGKSNTLSVDVTAYYATEIDKYAIQTTQHNFPETIQLGDAFQVRNDDWRVEK